MLNIILTASRDAFKLRDAYLATSEIKRVAQENASQKYPRETRARRGLYKYTFYKMIRYYEYRSWIEELNSYR